MFSSSKLFTLVVMTIAATAFSGRSALAKAEAVGMYDGTCQEFIGLVDANDDQSRMVATSVLIWVEGYISGANAMNSESIDLEPPGWDEEVRVQIIVGFCRAEPEATMEQVAAAYYLTLIEFQEASTS